jgi:hypothetical protein
LVLINQFSSTPRQHGTTSRVGDATIAQIRWIEEIDYCEAVGEEGSSRRDQGRKV